MADHQIVIAGFGGQGLLFSGKVLAYAGLIEGRRHGELQRHSVGRPGRLADRKHAERAHGYEQPFAR